MFLEIKNSPAATWDEFEAQFWPMYVAMEKTLRSYQAYTKFYTNEDIDLAAITSLKQHPVEDKNKTKSLGVQISDQTVLCDDTALFKHNLIGIRSSK